MFSISEIFKIGNGPSSSHTIGPTIACNLFKSRVKKADHFSVTLYGSLALTGKGHHTDKAIYKAFSPKNVNIIFNLEEKNIKHPNTFDVFGYDKNNKLLKKTRFYSIGGGNIAIEGENLESKTIYEHNTMQDILDYCDKNKISLLKYVKDREPSSTITYLKKVWQAMKRSIDEGLNNNDQIPGPLNYKRRANLILNASKNTIKALGGAQDTQQLLAYGIAVSENNAGGGIVVTGPTCGSCGVIPSVLFFSKNKYKFNDKKIIDSLLIAGIIGNIIRTNGSISGAEAGCQAECGSACAMAAGAYLFLLGFNDKKIVCAAKYALEHHLGLTCDLLLGYVFTPCISRNGVMACRAIESAVLSALLDENQQVLNFDDTVLTMKKTGGDLNPIYRETSLGGLAKTYEDKINNK